MRRAPAARCHSRERTADCAGAVWQGLCVLLALVLLNGSVTFHNIWPTLGVHWPGELSVEFGVLLLALALSNAWLGPTRRRACSRCCRPLVVLFALGRYAYVTVQALYGRDINLYWDGPQFAAVTGMFVRVASPWVVTAFVCGRASLVLAALYLIARWSLGQIDPALCTLSPGARGRSARWRCCYAAAFFVQQSQRCRAAAAALLDSCEPDFCRAGRPGLGCARGQPNRACAAVAAAAFEPRRAAGQ